MLANRIKIVLPDIISDNQSAFIQGRSISDNVLVAFEVIHHIRRKNRGNEGEVALKLDINKAYGGSLLALKLGLNKNPKLKFYRAVLMADPYWRYGASSADRAKLKFKNSHNGRIK